MYKRQLHEFNPMMGHRGCRLAVTYPEIAKMQTSAVIRAAINVKKNHPDWNIKPEIMIPLVGDIKELKYVKKFVVETADAEIKAAGSDLEYEVGTMIEIPRAALTADDIAKEADFFCFGTNDLTPVSYTHLDVYKRQMHATVAVLTALGTWNDVMTPLVIMSGSTGGTTLPLAQLNFQTQFGTNYNLAFASYLLALLPILLFYLICQKHILNGVVNGAVK